jgi:hypothetical protein
MTEKMSERLCSQREALSTGKTGTKDFSGGKTEQRSDGALLARDTKAKRKMRADGGSKNRGLRSWVKETTPHDFLLDEERTENPDVRTEEPANAKLANGRRVLCCGRPEPRTKRSTKNSDLGCPHGWAARNTRPEPKLQAILDLATPNQKGKK